MGVLPCRGEKITIRPGIPVKILYRDVFDPDFRSGFFPSRPDGPAFHPHTPKQTRDVDPMLCWCRASVEDGGPAPTTFRVCWVRSLLCHTPKAVHPSEHDALKQCCFKVGLARRRWDNIKTTLFLCIVFAGAVPSLIVILAIVKLNVEVSLYKPWRPKGCFKFEIIINV